MRSTALFARFRNFYLVMELATVIPQQVPMKSIFGLRAEGDQQELRKGSREMAAL